MDTHSIKIVLIISLIAYGCRCIIQEVLNKKILNAAFVASIGVTLILWIDNLID